MKTSQKSIYISAAHKSSGKTIISIGLARVISNLNYNIQVFKKGPDYIDMNWLSLASRSNCYNLDFNTQTKNEIKGFYESKKLNFNLIEGNKGLYDGVNVHGKDDNSAMSILLKVPVILVIDTEGITRGIAPLLQGYINFEKKCNIVGVILNKVKTERHEKKLINSVKQYTDLQILGVIRKTKELEITERHLGLIPPNENLIAEKKIDTISKIILDSIDKKAFAKIGIGLKEKNISINKRNKSKEQINSRVKVGIIRDKSFGFYYLDDIEMFSQYGAELININSTKTKQLPKIDALFIGGGFPEINAEKISKNKNLMKSINNFIKSGGVCYAECGGLMYLSNSIKYKNKSYKMVGVIPGNIKMSKKPVGRGYVKLLINKSHPWKLKINAAVNAHEFHHASINFKSNIKFKYAYNMKRGYGINGSNDGFQYKNLLANFSHLRHTKKNPWIKHFINFIKEKKND
jgi:cobyrinic acid a,c-diamide synthase